MQSTGRHLWSATYGNPGDPGLPCCSLASFSPVRALKPVPDANLELPNVASTSFDPTSWLGKRQVHAEALAVGFRAYARQNSTFHSGRGSTSLRRATGNPWMLSSFEWGQNRRGPGPSNFAPPLPLGERGWDGQPPSDPTGVLIII